MVLQIHNLARLWPQSTPWQFCPLQADQGDIVSIQGNNGVGKSTWLRVLSGLLPCSGDVRWAAKQQDLTSESWRAKILFIGDEGHYDADSSLKSILGIQLLLMGVSEYDPEEISRKMQLYEHLMTPWRMLSSGQKKRVILAPIITSTRPLWLLDEPYANLDSSAKAWLSNALIQQAKSGSVILFTGHDSAYHTKTMQLRRAGL